MSKFTTIHALIALIAVGAVACDKPPADAPKAEVTEVKPTEAPKVEEKKVEEAKPAAAAAANMTDVAKTSTIAWTGYGVGKSHTGDFKVYDGKAAYDKDGNLQMVKFTVKTDSMTSDSEKLTGHLKSPDFFNVAKFPEATFESTSIVAKPAGEYTHEISGKMNMLGVEKVVTFPATVKVEGNKLMADSEFKINRKDFNMTYGVADTDDLKKKLGDKAINEEVLMKIHVEAPTPKS